MVGLLFIIIGAHFQGSPAKDSVLFRDKVRNLKGEMLPRIKAGGFGIYPKCSCVHGVPLFDFAVNFVYARSFHAFAISPCAFQVYPKTPCIHVTLLIHHLFNYILPHHIHHGVMYY
jgi:hypothetical protein